MAAGYKAQHVSFDRALLRQPDGAQPARLISAPAGLNRQLSASPHFAKRFKMPRQER